MIMNILAGCNHMLLLYPRLEIPRTSMNPRMRDHTATTHTVISFRVTKGFGWERERERERKGEGGRERGVRASDFSITIIEASWCDRGPSAAPTRRETNDRPIASSGVTQPSRGVSTCQILWKFIPAERSTAVMDSLVRFSNTSVSERELVLLSVRRNSNTAS